MTLVVDASVALAWCFEDEATEEAETFLQIVLEQGALVPPLWRIEVANTLQMAFRRKRIEADYRGKSLARLMRLPITTDFYSDAHVWTEAMRLSDAFNLTVYDATYLELAQRHTLPLATFDQELRSAAAQLNLDPHPR